MGLLSALLGLLVHFAPARVVARFPHPAVPLLLNARAAGPGRERARGWADGVLTVLADGADWPVVYMYGKQHEGWSVVRSFTDLTIRRPLAVVESIWVLTLSGLLGVFYWTSGGHWYIRAACYAVVIAILSNQVRYLLTGVNLRQELRRTFGSPFLQFLIIVVTTFGALAIAAYILVRWPGGRPFQLHGLWLEARQIQGFGHLSAIWSARHAALTTILIALSGLAVDSLLLQQLFNIPEYRRNDADRIELATRALIAGRPEAAERWLSEAHQGQELPQEGKRAAGMLALARGDYAQALEQARLTSAARSSRLGGSWVEDDARALALAWAADLGDPDIVASTATHLLDDGMTDGCFASVILRAPEASLLPLRGLLTGPILNNYPLAGAMLAIRDGNAADAPPTLQKAGSEDLPERLARRLVAGYISIIRANEISWSRLRQVATRDTRALLDEMRSVRLEELPLWLRGWLSDDVGQRLNRQSPTFEPETLEGLEALHHALTGTRTGEDRLGARLRLSSVESAAQAMWSRSLGDVLSNDPLDTLDETAEFAIVGGPIEIPSLFDNRVFRYDVRHPEGRSLVAVVIDDDAMSADRGSMSPTLLGNIQQFGRPALEEYLRRRELPMRIFIRLSGEITPQFPRFSRPAGRRLRTALGLGTATVIGALLAVLGLPLWLVIFVALFAGAVAAFAFNLALEQKTV
jgi:hypothetical protein